MRIALNVVVEEIENYINRKVIVDENIKLIDLCEYIIISMNGKKIPIYTLEHEETIYYPYDIIESEYEKTLVNLTLKDFNLKKNKEFYVDYNFDNKYTFCIEVDNISEETYLDIKENFKVLSGKGYGILDTEYNFYLKTILTTTRKNAEKYYTKSIKEYLQKTFDVVENNNKIKEYMKYRKEMIEPKNYIFNVSLEGFNKEIKRKVSVNNDITIENFCMKIITSMNGDLSHLFDIKINKEFLGEHYKDLELFYLGLKEKQRLKIIYDYGDNWTFNLTLSKIIDEYRELDFEVLSGKGYGIIDDCGGSWGLSDIFYGNDTSWGDYDINDFDLKECNERVRKLGGEVNENRF